MKNIGLNKIITVEAGKRQSKPCIRGMRITVHDVIGWLNSGMTIQQIISDYPELNKTDISACSRFAQDMDEKHRILEK
ncbi:MAG: DUF433 domain-containing protein [Microscillaceae bacterium]|nr:DUF433 domain-containing protein [Microscillaceae bacterium]